MDSWIGWSPPPGPSATLTKKEKKKVLVLLSASVERVAVSRMLDFYIKLADVIKTEIEYVGIVLMHFNNGFEGM